MSLRSRLSLYLADKPSTRPDPKETAGHGGGLVSDAYFGDVRGRISTYNPDKLTHSTYDKMLIDPTLKACVSLMRYALKAVDWDVEGPDHDVTEFVRGVIDPVWGHILDSCTYGIAYGCSTNELVWQRGMVSVPDEDTGENRDVEGWSLAKVKDIKPSSLRDILVDGFENFAGYTLSIPQGVTLEAEKSLHYAHDMAYGNLWGNARLKAAYDPWYSRQILQALYLRFMERRVVPAVHVQYPPGYAADGSTPNANLAKAIAEGMQSNATATWTEASPDGMEGWSITLVEDAARAQTAQAFLDGMRMLDLKMMTAMLTPEKVLIGESGAYALSETHKDIWLLGVEGTLVEIIEAVNDQLIPRIVRYTFGDAPAPRIVIAGMSDEARALMGDLLGKMIATAGTNLDIDGICERMGIPVLEGEAAVQDEDESVADMPDEVAEEPVEESADEEMAEVRRAATLLREEVQRARLRLASDVR